MYLVIDSQHRVLARAIFRDRLEQLAADANARIVNVGTADVATIARIAAAELLRPTENPPVGRAVGAARLA